MNSISAHRRFSIDYIVKNDYDISDKDIYEFGVWIGGSMVEIQTMINNYDLKPNNIYGFDSFVGLPDEADGMPKPPCWNKGEYSAVGYMNANSIEDCMGKLKKKLEFSNRSVTLIPGFFNDVLNNTLLKCYDLKPAALIDMDVDLYISCYQVLDWMFQHNLIVENTLICYDDWGGVKEFEGGESKAHIEIAEKYKVKFEEIYSIKYSDTDAHKVFKVVKVGE